MKQITENLLSYFHIIFYTLQQLLGILFCCLISLLFFRLPKQVVLIFCFRQSTSFNKVITPRARQCCMQHVSDMQVSFPKPKSENIFP